MALGKKSEIALERYFSIALIVINYLLNTVHVNLGIQKPEY